MRKLKKKGTPSPHVPETIPEVEEKIEVVPLNQRACSTTIIKEERRRSPTQTPSFVPRESIQVETLEDEHKKWIEEMESEGDEIFHISIFYFTKEIGNSNSNFLFKILQI